MVEWKHTYKEEKDSDKKKEKGVPFWGRNNYMSRKISIFDKEMEKSKDDSCWLLYIEYYDK